MKLCDREQMREMDQRTIEDVGLSGAVLMEVAGRSAARYLHRVLRDSHGGAPKTIAIFTGGGNNGGDGYVMARHLDSLGYDVDVLMLAKPEDVKGDAWTYLEILRRLRPTLIVLQDQFPDLSADALHEKLPYYDVYVDALLGTGVDAEVRGNYSQVIRYMNEARGIKFAVDIPSGLDANTGQPFGIAFRADYTATMGMAKNGLFLDPGRDYAGRVEVIDIGILPETADEVGILGELLCEETLAELSYPRPRTAHKGNFGHVALVAGSREMPGAAALCAGAALVSGVGLTTLVTRESARVSVAAQYTELMTKPVLPDHGELEPDVLADLSRFIEGKSAVGVGPGLGREPVVRQVLDALLREGHAPVVIDADGLNVLADNLELLDDTFCPVILTPHPGEMSRLTGISVDEGMNDPLGWAISLAQQVSAYVVLKCSTTVLCAPDGRYAINNTGNPGMATGGSGDLLTGLLTGLLASGMTPWDAARVATFSHGRAGDLAAAIAGQRVMRAGHILEQIPRALQFLQ
ncbi:MAG: NAD(P)H-hydrate dehydratase [Myxococcales bacterium]|nr:NAD(P)H-hydrate dehydratase [Myxococcales bacterium]